MKKALYLPALLVLATACGSTATGAKAPDDSGATSTVPPVDRQDRTLACGTTIAPPLSESLESDPLRFTLVDPVLTGTGVAVTYRITAKDPEAKLGLPIGEVPPTALLLKGGKIVATETRDPSAAPTPSKANSLGYPVGRQPYENRLTVDHPCPGTTFQDVVSHPDEYRVIAVMSVQNAGIPKNGVTPLVQASAALRKAG